MQTSYAWNFAISQGLLQQISRHIKTYHDLLAQYITICPAWSKAAAREIFASLLLQCQKKTPFYPPQSDVFKKPTMTLCVVQFLTLQQPIKEALKMTWTLWDTLPKKKHVFSCMKVGQPGSNIRVYSRTHGLSAEGGNLRPRWKTLQWCVHFGRTSVRVGGEHPILVRM